MLIFDILNYFTLELEVILWALIVPHIPNFVRQVSIKAWHELSLCAIGYVTLISIGMAVLEWQKHSAEEAAAAPVRDEPHILGCSVEQPGGPEVGLAP